MTNLKKEQIKNMKTIAYYSGNGGIEVKDINDDYMICVKGTFAGPVSVHKVKINYTANKLFVVINGARYYLDEFIRR